MFPCGGDQTGWLRTFAPDIHVRSFSRSRIGKSLNRLASSVAEVGPRKMFLPAVPKRPTCAGGILKQLTLNHTAWVGLLNCGLQPGTRSGLPENVLVSDGSAPEYVAENG